MMGAMKRIDKSGILSTKYMEWLAALNRENREHPKTNRSYYCDVVMNLLYCQDGLCAYTEMIICSPELLTEDNWEQGKYKHEKGCHLGSLEHFDPRLKKGKFWEWGNLFVVHPKINVLKGAKEIDYILKPDSPDYDPMRLLEYDVENHIFFPSVGIDEQSVRERVRRMIKVLQLNHNTVRYERKRFFRRITLEMELELEPRIDCFFTAYRMVKEKLAL